MFTDMKNILSKNTYAVRQNAGIVLVEVLIACAILSVITFGIFSAAQKGIILSELTLRQAQSSFLLEEGAEAVKVIRDVSWATISGLTPGTTYYLSYNTSTNTWSLSITPSSINSFTRTVVFSAVSRDETTHDIVTSGGATDAGTKKVTITVSWVSGSGNASKTISFYISDIFS